MNATEWELDCGCDTRRETIGSDKWWTGVILATTAVSMGLLYGGTVTIKTKTTVKIGLAGALTAIVANQIIAPSVGTK